MMMPPWSRTVFCTLGVRIGGMACVGEGGGLSLFCFSFFVFFLDGFVGICWGGFLPKGGG
jgi:hypothetical protein